MPELHIDKVDNKARIIVDCVGFEDGDTVLYIKHDNTIYLAKANEVVGRSVVNNHRARLPRHVARMLNLNPGDHYVLIDGEKNSTNLMAHVRIVKLAAIVDEEGNSYGR